MAAIETRSNLNGKTTFRVKIRLKGYPVQHATFSRLTDARRWAQTTESAIREGRHFKTNEAKRHTLANAIKTNIPVAAFIWLNLTLERPFYRIGLSLFTPIPT
jgi:hypothetical protein